MTSPSDFIKKTKNKKKIAAAELEELTDEIKIRDYLQPLR